MPLAAGQGIGQDYEYEPRGARNLFLAVAPLMGYGAVAFDPTPGSCYNGGIKGVGRLARTAPVRYFVNSALFGVADSPVRRTPSGGRPRPVAIPSWRPRLSCGPVWG